jgi:hypothetical protein
MTDTSDSSTITSTPSLVREDFKSSPVTPDKKSVDSTKTSTPLIETYSYRRIPVSTEKRVSVSYDEAERSRQVRRRLKGSIDR